MRIIALWMTALSVGAAMACGSAYATPVDTEAAEGSPVPAQQPATLAGEEASAAATAETTVEATESVASYLEATVEPCIRLPDSNVDPCERRDWIHVDIDNDYRHPDQKSIVRIERSFANPPFPPWTNSEWLRHQFEETAEHSVKNYQRTPHILARGVFAPGTTRCTFHENRIGHLHHDGSLTFTFAGAGFNVDGPACYVDFRVGEYIVGRGPETLVVRTRYHIPVAAEELELYKTENYTNHLADHASRYWEGREFVVWLAVNRNLAVEVWQVDNLADVQRGEDGEIIVLYSAFHFNDPDFYVSAGYDIEPHLDRFEPPTLDEYVEDIRTEHAAASRELGFSPVEDANLASLREHLAKIGVYDQTEIEISTPPSISE